jgi:hypothetical protein
VRVFYERESLIIPSAGRDKDNGNHGQAGRDYRMGSALRIHENDKAGCGKKAKSFKKPLMNKVSKCIMSNEIQQPGIIFWVIISVLLAGIFFLFAYQVLWKSA